MKNIITHRYGGFDAYSESNKKSLENVSTKGGVSEAMVSALLGGASFLSSVERGIERCAELRSELCKNLAVKAA